MYTISKMTSAANKGYCIQLHLNDLLIDIRLFNAFLIIAHKGEKKEITVQKKKFLLVRIYIPQIYQQNLLFWIININIKPPVKKPKKFVIS